MERIRIKSFSIVFACVLGGMVLSMGFFAFSHCLAGEAKSHNGQTVYVPIYSFIYYGNKFKKIDLTATLSIRNTDLVHAIEILAVDYYNSDGKLIKEHVEKPIKLASLASTHFQVAESDLSGGLGASFVVQWKAEQKVSSPIVESVMIGAISAQGISFVCRGEVIRASAD
ncbi:DUF3124 domain-containing protein [Desulfoferrobacter suflitae]|uniref:DUF3124 domain-containing protein n=1 Tax=Desulfoferrobacter suflitae TaxID=2865782 RepID=UPI0021649E38|nr:DUF3124 domain-containing protein [Desulfoferrobacter suflitae]MCK8603209.1 DUF3124 domain-containing protein [Desulfoferrobacter suflitae]